MPYGPVVFTLATFTAALALVSLAHWLLRRWFTDRALAALGIMVAVALGVTAVEIAFDASGKIHRAHMAPGIVH